MQKLILLFLLLFSISSLKAQDFRGKEMTLAYHFVAIDDAILDSAFAGTSYLEKYRLKAESALELIEGMQAQVTDSAYEYISKALINELGFKIRDIGDMQGKVDYSNFGYPNALIMKKAAMQGDGKYYLKIAVNIMQKASTTRNKSGKLDLSDKYVKAGVKITISIFDEKGKKLRKITGESLAEENIKKYLAIKLIEDEEEGTYPNVENVMPMLKIAMKRLIYTYNNPDK